MHRMKQVTVGIFVTALLAGCNAQIDASGWKFQDRNELIEDRQFIQIPGGRDRYRKNVARAS